MVVCTVEAVTQLVDLSAAAEVNVPGADEHRDHRPHPHRGELRRGVGAGWDSVDEAESIERDDGTAELPTA